MNGPDRPDGPDGPDARDRREGRDWRDWFLSGTPGSERAFRTLVGKVTDLVLELAGQPARVPASTEAVRRELVGDLSLFPAEGIGMEAAWNDLGVRALRGAVNVGATGYAAHFLGRPLVLSAVTELAIGATNQSLDSFDQAPSATVIETALIRSCCDELGLPGGDGVLTPGASMSNLMGLLVARDRRPGERLRIICSAEAHHSVTRAAAIMGLQPADVVTVDTTADGAMDRSHLEAAICSRTGPTAVVVTIGSTDRGAIDPLTVACDLAERHGLWVHADAAASGPLAFSATHRHLLGPVHRCDSLSLDFHKLGWQSIPCGLFLVRDAGALEAVRHHADYLNPADEPDDRNLVWKSIQTTRRFDALKLALCLRALGRDGFDALVDAQLRAVRRVEAAVRHEPSLELRSCGLHTVVFRYVGPGSAHDDELDHVNEAIRRTLAADGVAVLGRAVIDGRRHLKVQTLNPLLTADDADRLVAAIAAAGRARLGASRTAS